MNTGSKKLNDKRYVVLMDGHNGVIEVPIYAENLVEATELVVNTYEDHGFKIQRIKRG